MTNDHLTAQRRAAIDAESVGLQQIWKPGLASGLLALLVGGLVLALLQASILVAATLFGVFLLGAGLAQLYFAFTLPKAASGRALLFVNGALSLVLATLSFRHFGDTYAVLLLSIWIGVGFVFQGVAETLTAISLRELPGRGWYIFGGILTWIAGLVMLTLPLHSIVVLTLVAGSWLVVLGIVQIVRALKVRGEIRRAS